MTPTPSEVGLVIVAVLVVAGAAVMAWRGRRKDLRRVEAEAAAVVAERAAEEAAVQARLDAERQRRLGEAHARVVQVITLRIAANHRDAADAVAEWHARSSERVTAGEISVLDPARRFETVAAAGGVN